jgi:nitroreductase
MAEDHVEALELMLARRSVRRFTAEDVSSEDEEALIDAAFAAPSSNNLRPWHFITVRDAGTRAQLKTIHRWTWMLGKAPLVIAVLGRHEGDPWWIEDCAAATENILLQATGLGLGSVWCGIREDSPNVTGDELRCCEILGVPVGPWRVLALIGIGHPAEAKQPRTQRQVTKLSVERFGKRSR